MSGCSLSKVPRIRLTDLRGEPSQSEPCQRDESAACSQPSRTPTRTIVRGTCSSSRVRFTPGRSAVLSAWSAALLFRQTSNLLFQQHFAPALSRQPQGQGGVLCRRVRTPRLRVRSQSGPERPPSLPHFVAPPLVREGGRSGP